VAALDLRISELKVWSKGDIGWYTMELDYGVYRSGTGPAASQPAVTRNRCGLRRPKRAGISVLANESFRNAGGAMPVDDRTKAAAPRPVASSSANPSSLIWREWDILEVEDDKHYKAHSTKPATVPIRSMVDDLHTKYADRLCKAPGSSQATIAKGNLNSSSPRRTPGQGRVVVSRSAPKRISLATRRTISGTVDPITTAQ